MGAAANRPRQPQVMKHVEPWTRSRLQGSQPHRPYFRRQVGVPHPDGGHGGDQRSDDALTGYAAAQPRCNVVAAEGSVDARLRRSKLKKRQPHRQPLPALRDATVTMPDGRRLAYTEWGLPDGKPVLCFHGTPGSRLWCPDEEATSAARVRLIMPDRPGIGRSDPLEGRTLADWPKDVEALADALQISSFAVVGVSAGGPYAAACAALIPGRLSGVALVSSRPLAK